MKSPSSIRSVMRRTVPFPVWQTAGFLTRIPSYWRLDRSEALRIRKRLPGLPLHVTSTIHVSAPESITAYRCWQFHGVEVNDSSAEVSDFLALSKDCRGLVDIGAQTGFISALFARSRLAPCRVLSVEPDSRVLPMLKRAAILNGSPGCDWTIAEAAFCDHTGTISIPAFNGVYEPNEIDHAAAKNMDVTAVTLAGLVGDLYWNPDIIKIDVESFEHEILCSSLAVLERLKPALQLEVHWRMLADRGRDARDFLLPLADLGYRGIRKRYGNVDAWLRAGRREPVSRMAIKPA